MRVRVNGETFTGKRWVYWSGGRASEEAADLGTVKLDRAAIGGHLFRVRSSGPPAGANLAMVGYPLGNRLSLNQGKIIERGRVDGAPLLAVRMLGAEGASGAPLVDDAGRVVGILQIGLGSEDVLGQRTAGVLVGLDLARWWGPRARLDLCRSYPKGGIAGCQPGSPSVGFLPPHRKPMSILDKRHYPEYNPTDRFGTGAGREIATTWRIGRASRHVPWPAKPLAHRHRGTTPGSVRARWPVGGS